MTLNPEPLVLVRSGEREISIQAQALNETEVLRQMYQRETELHAAGFISRGPDCPVAGLRKIVVFSRETGRTERIEVPSICDCENTRFRMGIGTKQCKAIGVCPVSKELFPTGTFS